MFISPKHALFLIGVICALMAILDFFSGFYIWGGVMVVVAIFVFVILFEDRRINRR
jgi:hypothetical protein